MDWEEWEKEWDEGVEEMVDWFEQFLPEPVVIAP